MVQKDWKRIIHLEEKGVGVLMLLFGGKLKINSQIVAITLHSCDFTSHYTKCPVYLKLLLRKVLAIMSSCKKG